MNLATAEISHFVPTNTGWVVLETPDYPSPQSNIGTKTLRMADDLSAYLMSRGDAVAVLDFGTIAEMPMNMLLHYGYPKYLSIPTSDQMSANLWSFFFGASAPDEPRSYFAHSPQMTSACVRLLLPDHSNARLTRLRDDLDYFVKHRVEADPALAQVKLRYLGGDAGLYQATDDVVAHLNLVNVGLTLLAILIICAVMFRSIVAGIIFAVAAVMANAIAFTYMNWQGIGLTADTIPLISLGIGLGISFAIYIVARIRDEAIAGNRLNEAAALALRSTGASRRQHSDRDYRWNRALGFLADALSQRDERTADPADGNESLGGAGDCPAVIVWARPQFILRYTENAAGDRSETGTLGHAAS